MSDVRDRIPPKIRGGSASEVASSRHDGAGSGGRAPEHPAPDEGLSIPQEARP